MSPVAEKKILAKLERIEKLLKISLSEGEELSPQEKKLVERGHNQIKRGEYVEWRKITRTV